MTPVICVSPQLDCSVSEPEQQILNGLAKKKVVLFKRVGRLAVLLGGLTVVPSNENRLSETQIQMEINRSVHF